MLDSRQWVNDKLGTDLGFQALFGTPARLYTLLGPDDTPLEKPFAVIRIDTNERFSEQQMTQDVVIWVHDIPTTYTRIDQGLAIIKSVLEGPVVDQDGILAVWQGDSPDLSDDGRKTLVRTTSYRIAGRR